jgi:hypothetical protein
MSFLDKVKAAAQDVGTAAKKGTAQIQGKIEQGQLRKKADDSARQLGYLVVRERTDGTPAGEEADRLVQEIVGLEAQMKAEAEASAQAEAEAQAAAAPAAGAAPATPAPAPSAAAPPPPVPSSASEPAEGDFKLGS